MWETKRQARGEAFGHAYKESQSSWLKSALDSESWTRYMEVDEMDLAGASEYLCRMKGSKFVKASRLAPSVSRGMLEMDATPSNKENMNRSTQILFFQSLPKDQPLITCVFDLDYVIACANAAAVLHKRYSWALTYMIAALLNVLSLLFYTSVRINDGINLAMFQETCLPPSCRGR